MILHFYGIPGAGKTYFASQIVDKFRDNNKRFINITELSRRNIILKVLFKLLRVYTSYSGTNKKLKNKLKFILNKYDSEKSKYSDATVDYYIDSIVFLVFITKKNMKRNINLIFDEGIPQQLANLGVNFGISKEVLKDLIYTLNLEVKIETVYYFCNIETSIKSIQKRDRHVTAIDELKKDELLDFLEEYSLYLKYIYNEFESKVCKREFSLEENFQIINSIKGDN